MSWSLTSAMGGLATSLFVPAAVIKSQAQTQSDLVKRQEALNANAPSVIANAQRSGVLSDGQVKQSLQDMNRSLFLVDDSSRQLGSDVMDITLQAAANAPSTAIKYASNEILKPAAGAVSDTVKAIVPWQIWLIVGLAVIVGVGVFAFGKSKV